MVTAVAPRGITTVSIGPSGFGVGFDESGSTLRTP
jgi:hypothetical protein